MVFKFRPKRSNSRRLNQIWLTIIAATIFVTSISCGGGSEDAQTPTPVVIPSPTRQVIVVTVAPTPTATPAPSPTAEVIFAELSDDEQAILDLWNSTFDNLLDERWDRFDDACSPEFRERRPRTAAQIEAGYKTFLVNVELTLEQLGFGEPIITLFGSAATVDFQALQAGLKVYDWTYTYTKSPDGVWYMNCT